MTVRFTKDSEPGSGDRADSLWTAPGRTIEEVCGTGQIRAWVDGREASALFIRRGHLKEGVEVFVEPIPADPVSLSIAASIAAGAASAASGWAIVAYPALSIGIQLPRGPQ